ncbi:MAG: hypothetical protein LBR58_10135 [Propionibacteriaceae bacterium]|jgi:hypothetical protein|nr:hypothetical protein [Propionibacteriaceae bacterium]
MSDMKAATDALLHDAELIYSAASPPGEDLYSAHQAVVGIYATTSEKDFSYNGKEAYAAYGEVCAAAQAYLYSGVGQFEYAAEQLREIARLFEENEWETAARFDGQWDLKE